VGRRSSRAAGTVMRRSVVTRPSRQVAIAAFGLAALNVLVFVVIAAKVAAGVGLVDQDEAVLEWFVDHRTPWMISAARLVSTMGGFVGLVTAGVLIGAWLWRHGTALVLAAAPEVAVLLAALSSTVTKAWFDRDRPPVSVHATTVTLAAFPSGHATDAAAFFVASAFTLGTTTTHRRSTRVLMMAVALLGAAVVGISRIVLAVHWLSDVVAGWALGTSVAIVVVMSAWYVAASRQPTALRVVDAEAG
jgi:undecaprenyl-diphosphatase